MTMSSAPPLASLHSACCSTPTLGPFLSAYVGAGGNARAGFAGLGWFVGVE